MIHSIITWNMQGATTTDDNIWRSVILPYMNQGYGQRVLCLQECGGLPSSSTRGRPLYGPDFIWARYEGFIICHFSWRDPNGRVNQALVLPRRPVTSRILMPLGGHRPAVGIHIDGIWIFCIHAASGSGYDVRRLLAGVQHEMAQLQGPNQHYRVCVAGDFNRDFNQTMQLLPNNYHVGPPNLPTFSTRDPNPQRYYDYLVLRAPQPIMGIVDTGNMESDHFPVEYHI